MIPSDLSLVGRNDFLGSMLGTHIGSGSARVVFAFAYDATKVVKFEERRCSFQNIMELEAWRAIRGTKWDKYFAPCYWISTCGIVMIQARTTPITAKEMPKRLPDFMTDLKGPEHFGRFEDRIVCHDYGVNRLTRYGVREAKMHVVKCRDRSVRYGEDTHHVTVEKVSKGGAN